MVRNISIHREYILGKDCYSFKSNSQLNDKGFVDSRCSRHMTGNIAHLSDFKDFEGGYVTFGRGAYGGRITGKEVFKPAIGFMKPFGCHVTILNTLDKLGKFDGKSDEGFFVGYSLSSKAFRVYNTRTRKVQENLHIGFLEKKPMIEGNGPKWLFDLDSLTQSMNYVPVVAGTFSNDFAGKQGVSKSSTSSQQDQDCIIMPIWKDVSYFGDDAPRFVADAQIQDKDRVQDENDAREKSTEDSSLEDNGTANQQVNTASPEVNTGSRDVSIVVPEVNTATLEDLVGPSHASEDTQVEFQGIELGNIPQSYAIPTTPHSRIHKDHPIKHVIGDVQSYVQTRRMKSSYSEQGFLSALYEGKTHQDLHTCLFACFLSQEDQKEFLKLLVIQQRVESMPRRGTSFSFKLCKKKVGFLWIYLEIEAINNILAYASYWKFMVYHRDVQSAFLYGQIEWRSMYVKTSRDIVWTKPLFIKRQKGHILLVQIYVDDIIFGSTKKELCDEFEKLMKDKFQMSSMGELTFYLDVKSTSTPTDLEKPLVQDGDAADVDEHLYRSMIGSLMYLTASRPDIIYLKGKPSLGLWYSKDSPLELVAYTDSDYARAAQDRKSTTGGSLDTKLTAGLWITATIDGHLTTITEASLRRHLKLDDHDAEQHILTPYDSPLHVVHSHGSDEGGLKLIELTTLVTKLSERIRVLEDDLKKTKLTYSAAVTKLILRVKKLEAKVKARTARKRARVVLSEDDEDVEDDSSKQGRKLSDAEVQEKASTETEPIIQEVTPTEVIQDQGSSEKGNSEVSTAGATKGTASEVPVVSTAEVNISTAGRTVTYRRRSEEKRTRKDKGKAIMTEPEPKKKYKKELEQERLSFAEAIRLQKQMDEEQRAQTARDEEIARQWDEEEGQRAMSEAKSSKKIDWNDPSVIRYHALKMKPKTVAQARRNMVKYLKNQGNYKISDFKGMSYNEIRPIFEKVWDFNQHIEPMDLEHGSERMKSPEKIEEEDVDTQKEMKEVSKESGAKRKKSLPRKSTRSTVKRQKMEEDAEKEDLKGYLDIVPREDVAEDVESLSTKYPIMDWKTCVLTENFMYYQIFRGDGSSKNYKVLSEMLEDFDRQDVMDLHRLVKERYSASRPEGYDLMLWGDLHTLFEPDEEDEIWKNQHEYNVISWSLYDFCGIHILLMQNGIAIHMLTEKKYPLSQEMISKMLNKRLEVDHESTQAYELLKFIRSQKLSNRKQSKVEDF
ncbi:hypothetical protein Tco_0840027 [Tanacetum coccineum]|uniref:Retroviral polymerase SH3-like domain-containing protein n=1 Tax=Tanacetum coccineum TaxID=301880 RepID=A0ABQ5ASY8_9ASTR